MEFNYVSEKTLNQNWNIDDIIDFQPEKDSTLNGKEFIKRQMKENSFGTKPCSILFKVIVHKFAVNSNGDKRSIFELAVKCQRFDEKGNAISKFDGVI